MSRISREAWGVCGMGLLVMLVAEILRSVHLGLITWGILWVGGWIAMVIGVGMAVNAVSGWVASAVSVGATILALYFSASGANGSFIAMSSIAVIALAVDVGIVVLVSLGLEVTLRGRTAPPYSVILGLAGVGVILLAGAFALLANGMTLGFLAFGFSLGLVGTALSFGTMSANSRPASDS